MMTNSFRKSAATLVVLSLAALAAAGAVAQSPAPPDAKPAAAQGTPAAPESKSAAPETAPAETKPAPAKSRRAPSGPKTPAQAPEDSPLAPLAWLEGCWRGMVNQRETREHWMPLRGNMMLGMSQTVVAGKTQDFEYLRLESRPDGIYYLAFPAGQNETPFKFAGQIVMTIGDRNDDGFPFVNPTLEFPQKLIYRRASEGWLYISLIGKVKGADKEVVYPMRRVDCESGEALPR
ncbi:MAG: DUF6265 family protein [Betaproteobacteria bacterium]